ncbi:MAG TPA: beta-ribofuranosylaminobenzene 5'-phosphate synthase family protein, partial [Methylomirabilota bacterium]|nr:beta-ribofuranosylaminobenzene 5'-phosphate synthase family protein [Methylomirabilota bacterium]
DVLAIVERLRPHLPAAGGVAVRVREAIPRHAGLGSGTQLELAVASALSRLLGDPRPVPVLAALGGRGRRSGIGIAAFERGGFVVDAGRSLGGRPAAARDAEVPPVIFQHDVPADWRFVLATPAGAEGLHGPREEGVFAGLPPMHAERVGRISRLLVMKVLPALLTDDVRAFGAGITEIQTLVGEHFAPYQGGLYATDAGRRLAERALKRGAAGVGQSSWGPTVFALTRGEAEARALGDELAEVLGPDGGDVVVTRASRGGVVRRVRA